MKFFKGTSCAFPGIKRSFEITKLQTLKLVDCRSLESLNFLQSKQLQLIELDFTDYGYDREKHEKEFDNFFEALKDLVKVQKVKIQLVEYEQSKLIKILEENNKRDNISDLLEFKIVRFYCHDEKETVDFSPLSEIFEIKEAKSEEIEDVQTFKQAFYFHPKVKNGND